MDGIFKIARRKLRSFWCGLRDWCGDSAYERYLRAATKQNGGACKVLTKEQFYVDQLDRRYSRPNRCC
jgi:uncharacterized short protein YbdD (DUF466 family)